MSVDDIVKKIPNQFQKAKESGDLFFFPSSVVRHYDPDTDIEVSSYPETIIQNPSKDYLHSFK